MHPDRVISYKKILSINIFTCMEMSRQSYSHTIKMPVKRLYDYLKWKADLEEEKRKLIEENN